MFNNIAVFKVGALGDVLMASPFVHNLRKSFPGARITFYVGNYAKSVVETNPNLDEVVGFDQNIVFQKKPFALLKLANLIRKKRHDVIFFLDKSWHYGLFGKFTRIKKRVGFDRAGEGKYHTIKVPYGVRKHEIDCYNDLLVAVGGKVVSRKLELHLTGEDVSTAKSFAAKFKIKNAVGLVPGGAKNPGQDMASRRWPVDNWVELARKISCQIVLFGGPDDKVFADKVLDYVDCVDAVGKLPLRASAALALSCKVVVVADSGFMHVAAAVGVPTLSIFGPTDPLRKAPPGHDYVWHAVEEKRITYADAFADYSGLEDSINQVSVDEVWEKLGTYLN